MAVSFPFLNAIAAAVMRQGFLIDLVKGIPLVGQVLGSIAGGILDEYRQRKREDALRADLEALLQARMDEVRADAEQIARRVAAKQPPEVQQRLTDYLTQVPVVARRSLRSAADPTGRTVLAARGLRTPEELMPLLPSRLPRFKAGDQPRPGDWVLEELLGVGGFAEVWKARHRLMTDKRPAVLKFCLTASPAVLEHEAKVILHLQRHSQHPGIVRLEETYLQSDPPCLRYEYVPGGDLGELIRDRAEAGGPDPREMTELVLQLAQTVAEAHRLGVVHGDLKPANVLVQRSRDGQVLLRVTDFGIGGRAAEHALNETRMASHAGTIPAAMPGAHTPLYASPQQKKGQKATLRDDVHALGMIWYQALIGDVSADRPGGRSWRTKLEQKGVAPAWLDLVERCLDDDPDERPANAAVLAEQLDRLLHPPIERPPVRKQQSSAGAVVLVALVLLVLVGGVALAIMNWPSTSSGDTSQAKGPTPTSPFGSPSTSPDSRPGPPPGTRRDIAREIGMTFVAVPGGTFWMSENGENAKRWVTVKPFQIGVYEVTQGEWEAILGKDRNRSFFSRNGDYKDLVKDISDEDLKRFPVENVSWTETKEYIKELNKRDTEWTYLLPTEEQWEYACRGRPTTSGTVDLTQEECSFDFYLAQPTNDLSSKEANFNGNYPAGKGKQDKYRQRPTKVGSFQPNRLGIYDMHGNVWEWCEDSSGASRRVFRGGCWSYVSGFCRAADRYAYAPSDRRRPPRLAPGPSSQGSVR